MMTIKKLKETILAFSFLCLFVNSVQAQNRYYDFRERNPENKVHILYLAGGDWHDVLGVATVLRRFLEVRHEYHMTYTEDYDVLTRPLDKYDVLLINGMVGQLTDAQLEGLEKSVKNGMPLLGLHSATAALYKDEKHRDVYVDIMGAKFTKHPPIHTFPVKVMDSEHEITKNIADFEIYDEMYFYDEFREGSTTLIEAEHEGEKTPIAWTRKYGKGNIFYTSLGHGVGAATNRHFQQLVLNGLIWLTENNK